MTDTNATTNVTIDVSTFQEILGTPKTLETIENRNAKGKITGVQYKCAPQATEYLYIDDGDEVVDDGDTVLRVNDQGTSPISLGPRVNSLAGAAEALTEITGRDVYVLSDEKTGGRILFANPAENRGMLAYYIGSANDTRASAVAEENLFSLESQIRYQPGVVARNLSDIDFKTALPCPVVPYEEPPKKTRRDEDTGPQPMLVKKAQVGMVCNQVIKLQAALFGYEKFVAEATRWQEVGDKAKAEPEPAEEPARQDRLQRIAAAEQNRLLALNRADAAADRISERITAMAIKFPAIQGIADLEAEVSVATHAREILANLESVYSLPWTREAPTPEEDFILPDDATKFVKDILQFQHALNRAETAYQQLDKPYDTILDVVTRKNQRPTYEQVAAFQEGLSEIGVDIIAYNRTVDQFLDNNPLLKTALVAGAEYSAF